MKSPPKMAAKIVVYSSTVKSTGATIAIAPTSTAATEPRNGAMAISVGASHMKRHMKITSNEMAIMGVAIHQATAACDADFAAATSPLFHCLFVLIP